VEETLAVLVTMTLPTAATDSAETSSQAATPAVLDSEETSTRPLAVIPTVLQTPTEIPTVPPTLVAITSAPPTPTEILMDHPTLAETTSLHQTTTTVLATLETLAMDQATPTTSDTTTDPLVNLLAMMT
jgi:hypothetical protein